MNQSNPKQERTPGPWQQTRIRSEIGTHEGCFVGDIVDAETAAHIVHCVNTYDELVGALEPFSAAAAHLIEQELNNDEITSILLGTGLSAIDLSRARAALAKAKGE